jgi:hypothetical protein
VSPDHSYLLLALASDGVAGLKTVRTHLKHRAVDQWLVAEKHQKKL